MTEVQKNIDIAIIITLRAEIGVRIEHSATRKNAWAIHSSEPLNLSGYKMRALCNQLYEHKRQGRFEFAIEHGYIRIWGTS